MIYLQPKEISLFIHIESKHISIIFIGDGLKFGISFEHNNIKLLSVGFEIGPFEMSLLFLILNQLICYSNNMDESFLFGNFDFLRLFVKNKSACFYFK